LTNPHPTPNAYTHTPHEALVGLNLLLLLLLLCRYAYPITVTGYSTGPDGSVTEVQAEADLEFAQGGRKPPKGVLNWVAQPQPGQEPEQAEVSCAGGRVMCWARELGWCNWSAQPQIRGQE
jgi:hypothetical protein